MAQSWRHIQNFIVFVSGCFQPSTNTCWQPKDQNNKAPRLKFLTQVLWIQSKMWIGGYAGQSLPFTSHRVSVVLWIHKSASTHSKNFTLTNAMAFQRVPTFLGQSELYLLMLLGTSHKIFQGNFNYGHSCEDHSCRHERLLNSFYLLSFLAMPDCRYPNSLVSLVTLLVV